MILLMVNLNTNLKVMIKLNLKCIAKSICTKFLTILFLVFIEYKLKLFTLPNKENLLLPFFLTQLFVTYFALILPFHYFISYYFHDLKVQIFVNSKDGILKIVNSKKIYDLKFNEVKKISKFLERRSNNDFFGFFYYKIETTMGEFYISMLSTWNLEKYFPDIPYEEISTSFPFIS